MIWIAMRHGIQGATIALAASHVGINLILGWRGSHAITVVEFQMLMLGLAVTMLFLGMTVSARRATEERLRREAELNQAMRLAAAGEMAQAIAHELNQPLSAVANYARASRSMLADPERHGNLLAETLEKSTANKIAPARSCAACANSFAVAVCAASVSRWRN